MRTLPRWFVPLFLALAVLGVLLTFAVLLRDNGGDWHRSIVGGSRLYAIDVTFARLLPFLIAGMVTFALLLRGRRSADAGEVTAQSIRRHELDEVLTHWVNAVGIGLCLITGSMLLRWLHNPFSEDTTYLLHFIGAGCVVGAVAHHLAYQIGGGGSGLIPRSWSDIKNAIAEVVSYSGVYRGMRGAFGIQLPAWLRRPLQRVLRALHLAPDPAGKYLATEKVLSYPIWSILIGIVVITGIVKAAHYVWALPGGVLRGATFLHDGATIFLLILLAAHVASVVLVPRNWALLISMFTTRISRAYVREHLPEWNEEIEAHHGSATPGVGTAASGD
jgi:cytochrome b subunit of formate dehydrogenase